MTSKTGRSKQTKIAPMPTSSSPGTSADEDWRRAIRDATIAHEQRPEYLRSATEVPEDVLAEALVSWTWNFIRVVEHAHEWGDFRA